MAPLTPNAVMFWYIQNGMTPLLAAAVGGKADVVKLLLERGAEINHAEKVLSCCAFVPVQ